MTVPERPVGYREIVRRVREEIARGERRPGDRLPSVRTLAAELGVNVNTVARAYGELHRDGSVETRGAAGSFVRAQAEGSAQAQWRVEQLQALMSESVLQALSLGHAPEAIEQAVREQLRHWGSAVRSELGRGSELGRITFVGSHDVALDLLATRLRHLTPPIMLEARYTGSTAGLLELLAGEADLAGCHLGGDDSFDETARQLQHLLPGRALVLVALARRQQGIIIPPGNPRRIGSIRDLARTDITLALRQAGSGTRLLLERELALAGLRRSLSGHPVLQTHADVAAAIAEGTADAGVGILAAARTYGLDFIPLAWERYDLVMPAHRLHDAPIQALLATLRSPAFKQIMDALGGYDTSITGNQHILQ